MATSFSVIHSWGPRSDILYCAWEDQSNAAYRILHTVLINCITVLYRVIQYSYAANWANTVQLCREFICGMLHEQHTVNH